MENGAEIDNVVVFDRAMQALFEEEGYESEAGDNFISDHVEEIIGIPI